MSGSDASPPASVSCGPANSSGRSVSGPSSTYPTSLSMVLGLDDWDRDQCVPIGEERLLAAVRTVLGPQVERLLSPPVPPDSTGPFDPFGEDAGRRSGPVPPVAALPHVSASSARSRPGSSSSRRTCSGRTGLVTSTRRVPRAESHRPPCRHVSSSLVPNGHVDDFPWRYFVHRGPSDCAGTLRFYRGRSVARNSEPVRRVHRVRRRDRSMVERSATRRPSAARLPWASSPPRELTRGLRAAAPGTSCSVPRTVGSRTR